MRVVDVGCGTAGLRALEPELEITGVDLARGLSTPGLFVQADVTEGLPTRTAPSTSSTRPA